MLCLTTTTTTPLIAVADDCPVDRSEVPEEKPGKKTVANIHYEILATEPFGLRQEDVLFETWFRHQPADRPRGGWRCRG